MSEKRGRVVTNIRKAKVADVPQIYELLFDFAKEGLMLPRSLSELYDVIRAFYVSTPQDRPDRVVGACALHVCWADLGEIRSLSVAKDFQGANIGAQLLDVCVADALELGLKRLFVLTYIPEYFKKAGFSPIEKTQLPQKIWADCFKCINFPDCSEVALERTL
jgi:amino-acid N-acetyltransferase